MQYTTESVWQKFQDFFKKKGHLLRPAAPIIPENEASVLFTSAGMQQFKQYYLEPQKAPSPRIVSCQPCLRTTDIDEVGDETHLTIFEMLGNFSFGYPEVSGSYFKKETIEFAWEFLTKVLNIPPERLRVTYFSGDKEIPEDVESKKLLLQITGLPQTKILPRDREENFWGPTGESGPCGRTVEIQMDGIEIWNLVFNEFLYREGKFLPLKYLGVDTGAGLERLTALLNNTFSVYEVDTLKPVEERIAVPSAKSRIIVDHLRAITHLIVVGVFPSNKEQGYVLRRLIRRTLKAGLDLQLREGIYKELFSLILSLWKDRYPSLQKKLPTILTVFEKEQQKYLKVLKEGIEEFQKLYQKDPNRDWGETAFYLYTSFGLPPEMTFEDVVKLRGQLDLESAWQGFREAERRHRETSRADLRRFKGGLAGYSPQEIRLHTATHLLQAALRRILGSHVVQKGANINPERLRFDFAHPHKLTEAEITKIEQLVNDWIEEGLPVEKVEMNKEEALKSGALGVFLERYTDKVFVYTIKDKDEIVSKEICGGPHVKNTRMLGRFKILKEESSSLGVRRIRATVEAGKILLKSI